MSRLVQHRVRTPTAWETGWQVAVVLEEDPDLAAGLSGRRLVEAGRECRARVVVVDRGSWAPEPDTALLDGGFGLLLLEGLILRRVGTNGRIGSELLGPGDLLRPWEHGAQGTLLPCIASYNVVQRSRLAFLDRRFAARAGRYPEVVGALVGRALERARTLVMHLAIAHHARVDHRLLLLFWHLARRWGRVTPHGVLVPLSITHQCLADLVAARRPSVSTGLARLSRDGLVTVAAPGWLLHEGPPSELFEEPEAFAAPED